MITLDGSMGEGGGQVLRTALALALVTGQAITIDKIRAGREKPGLKRQHLTAVLAAAEIGDATVEGAELGSLRLVFRPRGLRAGTYRFAIGTAGSTTLVLQTVLPALWSAHAPSTVELTGGTHNPFAPSGDFLQHAFAPVVQRMGAGLELSLLATGFHPAGGGQLHASAAPAAWRPVELMHVCDAPIVRARILTSQIARHVGNRERNELRRHLGLAEDAVRIDSVRSSGPGNAIIVSLMLGDTPEVVTELGERGVMAEEVAATAAEEARALLAARVPVGTHLADQLLLPMALAGGGAFRTMLPSLHTRTNAQVIERFLPVRFDLREDNAGSGAWIVDVRRA